MVSRKTEDAIQYILRHPVQFDAKYSDRCILTDSIQFRIDFNNYIKAQGVPQTKIPIRKFTQILWEYYTLWLNKPHGDSKEYKSIRNLQCVIDDILLNAADYISNRPNDFGADNKALDAIRTNKSFRKTVQNKIEPDPEKYENISQSESADFIWRLYESWAY